MREEEEEEEEGEEEGEEEEEEGEDRASHSMPQQPVSRKDKPLT